MNEKINPEMLTLARDVREFTQKDLAERSGIDQGNISRYEGGIKEIPKKDLDILSETLNFPNSFFMYRGNRSGDGISQILHRKRKTVPLSDIKRINGLMNIYRLGVEKLLNSFDITSSYYIPEFNGSDYDTIEEIARNLRGLWEIPPGPISNLIGRLEAASCIVLRLDFRVDQIDEAVLWTKPLPPIILVNSRAPGDRLRFSLAHALGHLVLHQGKLPYPEMEREADMFASAFLMPAEDIQDDLEPVTIDNLLRLKLHWKVSVQAMIRRSLDLGIITERRYTSLFQMLSRYGYRKKEPIEIPAEKPESITELLNAYKENLQYTDKELAALVNLSTSDFRTWYYPDNSHLTLLPPNKHNYTKPLNDEHRKKDSFLNKIKED